MSYGTLYTGAADIDLQRTLATYSTEIGPTVLPHHPICCVESIAYEEEGSLSCPHAEVPADSERVQSAVRHSIALLIIELATQIL